MCDLRSWKQPVARRLVSHGVTFQLVFLIMCRRNKLFLLNLEAVMVITVLDVGK